ncbi:putative inactive heme oxygenase 2, chloroplastic isoform X2 [Apium graveolens]|uniref:putative inactive heme oxygenase 2, chloroplastic isoform X2 n=1 Tax=Apium graveolens TaxID=4045 RepID=UPI003D79BE4E
MWNSSSSNYTLTPTLTCFPKLTQTSYTNLRLPKHPLILRCSELTTSDSQGPTVAPPPPPPPPPPVLKKRRRYRKQYPGEKQGITEEMRFVAMKLRESSKVKPRTRTYPGISQIHQDGSESSGIESEEREGDETWVPSMDGFAKYLVDNAYFRKTGLERSDALSKDLEWMSQQDIVIPEPSSPGVTYVKYLEELAETSPSLFLSHFYNIYFSHIAGGQVIAKQVSEKLLEAKQLEFYTWEGESEELLRGVREKLNMLGEHWSRDDKNKCLREATKSFRFLGQIVRLIIL